MEEKNQIDERRVKSTIIRRRKKEEVPEPIVAESATPAKIVDLAPASSSSVAKTAAQKPVVAQTTVSDTKAAPAKPAVPGEKKLIAAAPLVPILTPEEIEEAEKAKLKKPQAKKGSKQGVEVEGIGHVSTITQLTRIAHVERVFEPGKSGPGTGLRRRKVMTKKSSHKTVLTVSKQIKRVVEMDKGIAVGDLSRALGVKSSEIIRKLMGMGMMVTLNQILDFDTATLVAQDYQYEVKSVAFDEKKVFQDMNVGVEKQLISRPPVVTVMGHVDHGKTSLLDAIRETNVTAGEAGGITQHIGAYTVTLPKGKVTFLDTPGHEAFTSMRARGAAVTDLVILVVAADDGVMPQTIESIDHAKAAGVPIVVAVNKIDKPEADVERIKRQLSDRGLMPEEWGGETLYALVSAKKKQGIEELLATVLLQAEILELKADPTVHAQGSVVEARLDKSRGPVSTILVREGTLKAGDIIVAGQYSGKVRAMMDHTGKQVKEAPPSTAVQVMGLDGVPMASDPFHVVSDEQTAAHIVENRRAEKRQADLAPTLKVSLEDFFAQAKTTKALELNIIIKTDMQGSLEAVVGSLTKIETEKVKIRIIHSSVGGITESDVLLASASNAIIIGFNVRPDIKAMQVAQLERVDIKVYKIIYEMINEVKLAMRGLLAPTKKEKYLGRAEVRDIFTVSKVGIIAGSYVIDGKITRSASVRILRDNIITHEGKIISLKRFKDDAREVLQNFECGIGFEGYQDLKKGDVIEAFEIELIQTEL